MDKRDLFTVSEIAESQRLRAIGDPVLREPRPDHGDPDVRRQRRFERQMLRRLAFIRAARNVGLSLDEVAAALARLPDGRTPTRADWTRLSKDWRARLDDQIAGLIALRDNLDSCIGCGCLSLKRCAISNPGDTAAVAGPGAVYLPGSLRERGRRSAVRRLRDLAVRLAQRLAPGLRRQARRGDLQIGRVVAALVLEHFADLVVLLLLVLGGEVLALRVAAGVDHLRG